MKKHPYIRVFFKKFFFTVGIGIALLLLIGMGAFFGLFGSIDDADLEALTLDSVSRICYIDADGNEQTYTTISSELNRSWVDIEKIPKHMKDAIVAIEDERFYTHNGFDIWRTSRAIIEFGKNKITRQPSTFGGSTITQQLVKNITSDDDRTAARKIVEISRAVNLEKKMEKDEILEMYLNVIYLSNGCTGVQTASQKFFDKPVTELNLAECASIAGITQYPSLYDPLAYPQKNKEKQEIVLKKMLDLGFINKLEYDEAIAYELKFRDNKTEENASDSYFTDHVIATLTEDLTEIGYTEAVAKKLIYSGGLRIVSTVDPTVQTAAEEVFENTANFPNSTGDGHAQSAIVVIDPQNGQLKGLVGGIGKKTGALVLNRATQTKRQPGSTIKPIAVYAPAFEMGLINPASIYTDKQISYGTGSVKWTPQNYDRSFRGDVSVRIALRHSLNTIPVQILDEMGADYSFDFLTQKLGITSLVGSPIVLSGVEHSDIGLSQLALGGLTYGISPEELAAAYVPFANRGIYTEPHCYTAVYDARGELVLDNEPDVVMAMSEQTAYITSMLLQDVVTSGTGGGAGLSSGMFTAGKTGTTSDNHDRWFVGYTPHYVASVWYGYDMPKPVSASGNPCIPVWKAVMTKINANKQKVTPSTPVGVRYMNYCTVSGDLPGEYCEETVSAFWFDSKNAPNKVCHSHESEEEEYPSQNEAEQTGETVISVPESQDPTDFQPSESFGESSGQEPSQSQRPETAEGLTSQTGASDRPGGEATAPLEVTEISSQPAA